jgi:hypothetical protein
MPTKRAPRSQTTKTVLPVRAWKPPPDIDKPCVALSTAMNQLPGIQTTESCCGHGTEPYRIWFRVTDFAARGLLTLARCTCPRYYDSPFKILLNHGDTPEGQVSFLLEGPVGDLSCPAGPHGRGYRRVRGRSVPVPLPTRMKKGADRRTFEKADLLAEILLQHVRGTTPGYNILLETPLRYTRPARRHS